MINILGKRYIFFAISLLIIIPGMIVLAIWGLPLSIDFTGGSLLEASFASGKVPPPAEIRQVYTDLGVQDVSVQTTSAGTFVVRSSFYLR
jgi:preprotein translocase subunit SecF